MNTLGSYSPEEIRELLNRYLSGETSAEENAQVEGLRDANPDVAEELRQMERARALLRQAVAAESVPNSLRHAVRNATVDADDAAGSEIDFGVASIITLPHSETGRSFRRYYAVAAVLLLLVAGWFALRGLIGESNSNSGRLVENGDAATRNLPSDSIHPVREILRVGLADHLKCAVAYYKKRGGNLPQYSEQKMRAELGEEFAELIPVVEQTITEGKLLAAHRCAFGERRYVHLMIVENGKLISVAITHKGESESLIGRDGAADTSATVPVYRAAMDGFEVAGFESGKFLVFVASDLPERRNLQMALNVVDPVSRVLGEVEEVI